MQAGPRNQRKNLSEYGGLKIHLCMKQAKLKRLKNGAQLIGCEKLSDIIIMWMNPDYTLNTRWATLCAACMYTIIITTIMAGKMTMATLKMIIMESLLTLIMHVGMAMKMIMKFYMSFIVLMVSGDFFQKMKCSNCHDILLTKNTNKRLDY